MSRYRGDAMGTYVAVTYSGCSIEDGFDVGRALSRELDQVDAELSTWRKDSSLARFNAGPAGEWVPVPASLAIVVAEALELSRQSNGAFDVTVAPSVNLWGFGPKPRRGRPNSREIQAAMERIGYWKLEARLQPPALRKQSPTLSVDLSAIGKGHGVDRLAQWLERLGCANYLVDIGGEVRSLGLNPNRQAWRIGVERPDGSGLTKRVLLLSGEAAATSGDYRNFRWEAGRRLSHTIDPRIGAPVTHRLASVTTIAPSAATADGLATLINVLGPADGLAFANARGIAALLLVRRQEVNGAQGGVALGADRFEERYTEPMRKYLANAP